MIKRKNKIKLVQIPTNGINNEIMSLLLIDDKVILYLYHKNISLYS